MKNAQAIPIKTTYLLTYTDPMGQTVSSEVTVDVSDVGPPVLENFKSEGNTINWMVALEAERLQG